MRRWKILFVIASLAAVSIGTWVLILAGATSKPVPAVTRHDFPNKKEPLQVDKTIESNDHVNHDEEAVPKLENGLVEKAKAHASRIKANVPWWVVITSAIIGFCVFTKIGNFIAENAIQEFWQNTLKSFSPIVNYAGATLVGAGGVMQWRALKHSQNDSGAQESVASNYGRWGAGMVACGGIAVALSAAAAALVLPA